MSDPEMEALLGQQSVSLATEPESPTPTPGMQLSVRRQEMNWSVEQVANQLNLAPRQIAAIEADDYAALPGMASLRGFIRSYAKLLKLDATPLLQLIANEVTPADALIPLRRALPSKPFADNRLELANKRRISPMAAVLAVLVCGGIAVFAALQLEWTSSSLSKPFSFDLAKEWQQFSSKPLEQPLALGSARAQSERRQDQQQPAGNTMNASSGVVAVNLRNAPEGSGAAAVTEVAAPISTPATGVTSTVATAPATTSAKDVLVLRIREDSWVEILRADNSTVMSRLLKAGEIQSVQVAQPLNVKIGNAAGVDATLRGAPLDLQTEAKSNVARLTLK